MNDTRLGWLEKMMMEPSRPYPSRPDSRQKMPQKKPPHNRPASAAVRAPQKKEGSV